MNTLLILITIKETIKVINEALKCILLAIAIVKALTCWPKN